MSEFYTFPTPSPTSDYNINLRYYIVKDPASEAEVSWDIGREQEEMLESLYPQTEGLRPIEFERMVRDLIESRLKVAVGLDVYQVILALALGNFDDVQESMTRQIKQSTEAELRIRGKVSDDNPLLRQVRRFVPNIFGLN